MTESNDHTLLCGDRVPNFSVQNVDDQTFLFYEFAVGLPVLFLSWSGRATEAGFHGALPATLHRADGVQVLVLCDSDDAPNLPRGSSPDRVQVLLDPEAQIRRALFGSLVDEAPVIAMATDRNLRVLTGAGIDDREDWEPTVEAILEETLADADIQGEGAPVLLVPRVLSPDLCRVLVEQFDAAGSIPSPVPSGTSDDAGELVIDPRRKVREDAAIQDASLEQEVVQTIARRVLPEVHKAFCYQATHFERLKLVRYPAAMAGHFSLHRDNTAPETAQRRFALTLNLNSGAYAGGELVFPEYGDRAVYAPPSGGAMVFSGSLAHEVRPVVRGTRYALVSFMHDARGEDPSE